MITASIREVFERKTVPRSAIEMSSKVLMTDGETATEVVKCKLKVDDRGKPIAAGYQGDSTKRVAASKRLTPGAYSRTQRSDFHREAFLRAGLSSHAQVVNCLGVQMDMEPEYIFIDFAAKGNLRSILRNTKASKNITGACKRGRGCARTCVCVCVYVCVPLSLSRARALSLSFSCRRAASCTGRIALNAERCLE